MPLKIWNFLRGPYRIEQELLLDWSLIDMALFHINSLYLDWFILMSRDRINSLKVMFTVF